MTLHYSLFQAHVFILKHVMKVGSDNFNSSPSTALGDKMHNPADQLTAINEHSAMHTVTSLHNGSTHLQVISLYNLLIISNQIRLID